MFKTSISLRIEYTYYLLSSMHTFLVPSPVHVLGEVFLRYLSLSFYAFFGRVSSRLASVRFVRGFCLGTKLTELFALYTFMLCLLLLRYFKYSMQNFPILSMHHLYNHYDA